MSTRDALPVIYLSMAFTWVDKDVSAGPGEKPLYPCPLHTSSEQAPFYVFQRDFLRWQRPSVFQTGR